MAQVTIPVMGTHALFYQLWSDSRPDACAHPCEGSCGACRPGKWVVTRLLGLVANEPGKTVQELAPMIQGILEESWFVGDAGELVGEPEKRPPIHRQTDLVVMTLERMRSAKSI
jgi:hypothetical protein